jgi:hypothetical protein
MVADEDANRHRHSSIQVTFDTYGHLWENTEDDLKAVAEMEKRLLG